MKPRCGHPENAIISTASGDVCQVCTDNMGQCVECKLWYPEYDPRSEGECPTSCDECGSTLIQSVTYPRRCEGDIRVTRYVCRSCDRKIPKKARAKCLDGNDEDGNMSHVSGKPALDPTCIFCDSPGDNEHATRGIDFSARAPLPGYVDSWGWTMLQIAPLPVSYMGDAGLLPPKFDNEGNAYGYIVLRFGNAGRADYWDGECWVNYREFSVTEDFAKAIFGPLKDAQNFVEKHNG